MTNQIPPDPQRSRRGALSFDEWVAVLVAFPVIGIILWWGLSRIGTVFDLAVSRTPQTSADSSDSSDSTDIGLFAFLRSDAEAESDDETDGREPDLQASPSSRLRLFDRTEADSAVARPFARTPGTSVAPAPVPLPDSTLSEPSPSPATPLTPSPSTPSPESTSSPIAPTPPVVSFPDVPQTYWASAFIAGLAQQGRLRGLPDGSFAPDQQVTRGQFAAQLEQAFDRQGGLVNQAFSDVTADYWAYDAIAQATQMGFMNGYPDGAFRPEQPITRLEVLLSLATGLGLTPPATQASLSAFGDRAQIPEWATPKIAAATEAGLVVNYPNVQMLNPAQPTTRAEAVAMIYQALVSAGEAESVPSDYVVSP